MKKKRGKSETTEESDENREPAKKLGKKTKRKKKPYDESDDDVDVSESGSSDDEDNVRMAHDSDDGECNQTGYDLDKYSYLKDTIHYDPDDAGVFKCVRIVAEDFGDGAEVVVYRCKYNAQTGKWGATRKNDPIHVADVVKYYEKYQSRPQAIVKKAETTRQRK